MSTFNVEQAVAQWRQELIARGGSDTAFLAELESGLYDRYESNLVRGLPPETAFAQAKEKLGTSAVTAVAEHRKALSRRSALGFLLPSYLKTGLRTLRSRPSYNLINYLCLVVGVVTAALAFLYLNFETNFDGHVPNVDQKFRVGMNLRSQGYSMISYPNFYSTESSDQLRMTESLEALPNVNTAVQFQTFPAPQLVTIDERELATEDILHTNTPSAFVQYFGWRFLLGSVEAFAATPNTAALTETEARRFFGDDWSAQNLIGASLRIDTTTYTIAGVINDPPANTHYTYRIALHRDQIDYWGARFYISANGEASPTSLAQAIDANFASLNPRLAEDELFGGVIIQPLQKIHLGSDLLYELKPPGKPAYLYVIGIIALLVLLLTISNYTNLSVAMNTGRSREIGMRKVFGASERQIAGQFQLETVLLSVLTLPVVVLLLYFLLPRFDALMGTALMVDGINNVTFWLTLVGCTLLVGLLAGLYPALYLSRLGILGLFNRKLKSIGKQTFPTRKVLIVGQFVLLIGLCSLTFFVNRQLRYLQEKDLGFTKDNVLYVNVNADSARFSTFKNEVLRLNGVTAVGSGTPMGQQPYNQTTYKLTGQADVFDDANNIYMDYAALDLLDIDTSIPEYVSDPENAPNQLVLINTTLAERLQNRYNLSASELIGQTILQEPEYVDEETGEVGFPYEVAGTFGDVNMFSLRERVDPMFMTVLREPRYVYWAAIRYTGQTPPDILSQVRQVYDRVGLAPIFTHAFLNENLTELYEEEARIATLSTYFSLVAFLTAILGLIALTAFLTALRRREIGIRRILGASQLDILLRYNQEYWPLLGIALVVAVPLTWLVTDRWLSGFAYRIAVDPWTFLLAAAVTLLVTSLAVSVVTLRASRGLPARVLTLSD